nr:uncharacterized protein LOC128703285 [Cherax quadricarinatus]
MKPGPQGIPDVQTACAGSTDTSCTIKYLECKILTPRTLRNRTSTNRRLCLGLKVANCETRAQTCNQMLHPSPALHSNMTDCMTKITGCPLHPRVDEEARDLMKQCLERLSHHLSYCIFSFLTYIPLSRCLSFRADIENLNDTAVKEEVLKNFDSCYKDNEMPEITKCLVKKCINVVSV